MIISVLSEEWPLSLKKIYFVLKKKHYVNVSYQAVHKSIKELVDKNVLEKIGREYQLDLKWINSLREFSDKIKECYKTGKSISEKIPNAVSVDICWELYPLFMSVSNN